jgi:hypothetical protein
MAVKLLKDGAEDCVRVKVRSAASHRRVGAMKASGAEQIRENVRNEGASGDVYDNKGSIKKRPLLNAIFSAKMSEVCTR